MRSDPNKMDSLEATADLDPQDKSKFSRISVKSNSIKTSLKVACNMLY